MSSNSSEVQTKLIKLQEVFEILGFRGHQKKELLKKLLNSIIALAVSRVVEEDTNLQTEIKNIDTEQITPQRIDSIVSKFDEEKRRVFTKELSILLDEYIKQVTASLDLQMNEKISRIWSTYNHS